MSDDSGLNFPQDAADRIGRVQKIGGGAALGWSILCAIFFVLIGRSDGETSGMLAAILVVMALVLPLALILVATALAVQSARSDGRALALRHAISAGRRQALPEAPSVDLSPIEAQLAELSSRIEDVEIWLSDRAKAIDTMAQQAAAPSPPPVPSQDAAVTVPGPMPDELDPDAPDLGLSPPPEPGSGPLSLDTLIRALEFPSDANDQAGFDAMRAALQDHRAAQLVTAAQDVLTLLSQDGLYMDDMPPDRARVELWRAFADGLRGGEVAPLGGIRDEEALAICISRMRSDTIYRDAMHHFLRLFDHRFAEIAPEASDAQIAALTDTRSARAFMLLGRATGIFQG